MLLKAISQSETVKFKKTETIYESESKEEHSESEFYYAEDTISGNEAVFNATDENQKSEAPALQNSLEEIENAI